MTPRSRHLLIAILAAIPFLAYSGPSAGHNGRDRGPAVAHKPSAVANANAPASTQSGIVVTRDPKTGARIYTQIGPVAPNPALAKTSPVRGSGGPGLDYWVRRSEGEGGAYDGTGSTYADTGAHEHDNNDNYDDSYAMDYGYGGGYLPIYGGDGGRPGHGGGGRPGRPGDGGEPPRTTGGGYNLQPGSGWSPPPGPRGGGIGSPTPGPSNDIGSPDPLPLRFTTRSGRGGRR